VTKREAVDYLHDNIGYSRRLSAKLADVALLAKSSVMQEALRIAIENGLKKEKK